MATSIESGWLSRRRLLASPLFVLLGKLLGIGAAPAQGSDSPRAAPLLPGSIGIPQAEIDHFDVSFLPSADLTFALVADTHADLRSPSVPLHEEYYQPALRGADERNDLNDPRTAKVYTQLNANRPSFVIHLGDLVHGHPRDRNWPKLVEKANALLQRLEIPAYLVPGNHDIGNKLSALIPEGLQPGSTGSPRDIYYVSPENIQAYEQAFGPSFFHFESSGSLFLVVNASALNSGLEAEAQQWRWLEETLAMSREGGQQPRYTNVFLAMHSLPFWHHVDEPGERNYEVVDEPGRSRLLALCAEYDVRAIFTGHIHHDHLRYHDSTLIAASPSACFSRDHWGLYYPLAPPTWDPARAAYCQVRVRGRKIVRQLVRTVDLLPAVYPCQEHGTSSPRRLMPRQTGDGAAGVVVITVPVMHDQTGLAAPSNAVSNRSSGAGRADELRVAWVSGRSEEIEKWLEVSFVRPQVVAGVVVEPGMRRPFNYQIELRLVDGSWVEGAQGASGRSRGDRPPVPISHAIDATEVTAVRLLVPQRKGQISVRGFQILSPEGVDMAALPALAQVSASSSQREVKTVNTAAFTQGFDLNPLYLRLDPRATAMAVVSPVPGIFVVDPRVVESVLHARREGARLWVVLTPGRTGDSPGHAADDGSVFRRYCREVAQALEGVDVWEIDGDRWHALIGIAAVREVSADARFAVRTEVEVPFASFAVTASDDVPTAARHPTLLVHPPFPCQRNSELAARLARWLVTCLDSALGAPPAHLGSLGAPPPQRKRGIPCVSLLAEEGLLDGWDDPMPAFYVVRVFNTVLAGSRPSARHCQAEPGLSTVHLTSPAGRFIIVSRTPGAAQAPVVVRLLDDYTEAWWIDPLTSVSRQLVIDGRELRGLLFPEYPVMLRLVRYRGIG